VPPELRDCPDTPNCVSSRATDDSRRVEPFPCATSCEETLKRLQEILESMPRTSIVNASEGYLHVTFTTPLLRFVDDLELLASPEEGVLHVRSASRVGTWDLGVNRRRVEDLRRRLARQQPTTR
jgi:uncharacterized protein (DUF1499 family)